MKTITIDNQTIEISDESFENLKKQFCGKDLPKSWAQLGKVEGYYVCTSSTINETNIVTSPAVRNTFKHKKEAISSLARAQLSQLMCVYNEGWEPDWGSRAEKKYCIIRFDAGLKIVEYYIYFSFLAFKTKELAEKFLANFEGLIKQYFEMEL